MKKPPMSWKGQTYFERQVGAEWAKGRQQQHAVCQRSGEGKGDSLCTEGAQKDIASFVGETRGKNQERADPLGLVDWGRGDGTKKTS